MKVNFMISHPLREKLTSEDWNRIHLAWEGDIPAESITEEEWDAAHDVMFDAYAANMQTHLGVYTLQ
jgi:hypothetical protein